MAQIGNIADKTLKAAISSTEIVTPGADGSTEALLLIDYEHHEIHSGSHFFLAEITDNSLDDVEDYQIITPNTDVQIHFTFLVDVEAETEILLYENVSIATFGTAKTLMNSNRNSNNASTLKIYRINNSGTDAADIDTVITNATVLYNQVIGALRSSGFTKRSNEIILKKNTRYSLRVIANTAGNINVNFQWYEHTPKN